MFITGYWALNLSSASRVPSTAMSTTALTTTNILPSSVPKLLVTGLNWTTFSMHFEDAIRAKGLWGHFDGSVAMPTVSLPATADEEAALTQWNKDDLSTKALLTHQIPDSTLIRIHGKPLLKDQWDLISKEYTLKGSFAQADLHSHFMESKCPDKGNVQESLDGLRVKKEELATYGVVIEDKDYHSTIITSLPHHLSNFVSNLLADARLYSTSKTIDPNELILLISEEFERNVASRSHRSNVKSMKGNGKDNAMSIVSSGKGKRFERKPRGVCWNCREKGHFKDKCPKPAKTNDKKDDSPKKGGSVNAAIESDSEDEAAFFAELCDSDSDMPKLQSVSDSDSDSDLKLEEDSDGDWFSEIGNILDSNEDTEELFGTDGRECGSFVSVDLTSVAVDLDEVVAYIESSNKAESSPHVEVYDSGCMRHITPYCNAVDNSIKISPKSFWAANKHNSLQSEWAR